MANLSGSSSLSLATTATLGYKALGTPVFGAGANSPTDEPYVNANYVSGILATDVVLLFIAQKPRVANSGTITTPAGWSLVASKLDAGGYGTTLGSGTGNTNLKIFSWDAPVAGQTGTLTVSLGNNSVTGSVMCRIPTGGGNIQFGSATGEQATTPTSSLSISTVNDALAPNFKADDIAIWQMVTASVVGYSAHGISAGAGITFNTPTEALELGTGGGNQYDSVIAYAKVSGGSSTTAPTVTATLSGTLTDARGPAAVLRIRQTAPVLAQLTGSSSLTFTSTANLSSTHTGSTSGTTAVTFSSSATLGARAAISGTATLKLRARIGFPDWSWTATATGARKSAQAGYIDPVYFANHQGHKGCAIFEVSAAGDVDFYVERVLGETGTISTTISTFNVLTGGALAGTHYEAISETVTYTDGEIGWKKVTIPVTAIPTGFGVIGLRLSNYIPDGSGTARNEYCYIWLQGTGKVAGAKYLNSLGSGVESNGDTSGDGTEGNPWRCPSYAATQMGHGGGVLYVSSAGGSYRDSGANKSVGGGAFVFENVCTVTNPLICLPNPDNIAPVLVDNGLGSTYVANPATPQFAGGWSDTLCKTGGIRFGNAAAHIWLVGINVRHGNIFGEPNDPNGMHHIVLWKLESRWVAFAGSNVNNIRLDSSYDCIYDSCIAAEAYTYEGGGGPVIWPSETPGPYYGTVVNMHMTGSIQSFHSYGMRVIGCTMDNGQYGVYQKNAPGGLGYHVGYFTYTIKHCLFKRMKHAGVMFSNAGNGSPPTLKAVVGYCVNDGNTRNGVGTAVNLVSIYMDGPASAQSDRIDVYNCVTRNNGFVGSWDGDHVRYFNIISEDAAWQWNSSGQGPFLSRLEYGDYCLYVRGATARDTHKYNGTVTYPTLASWRLVNKVGSGVTDDQVLMSEPDKNSTESSITPAYADAAAFDYRWDNTLGYGGQYVGLGHMTVGYDIIDVVVPPPPPPPTIYYPTLGDIFANTLQSEYRLTI